MIKLKNIGYHESPNSKSWIPALNEGVRCLQIMLGNPRSYYSRALDAESIAVVKEKNLEVIAHGPYVTSLVRPLSDDVYKKSLSCYSNLTKNSLESNIKTIVVHVGGILDNQTEREARRSLESFLTQWLMSFGGQPITFCLETDPGSKNGKRIGGIRFLYPIIRDFNNPQIKLCWDWEHSYANGFDLTKEKNIDSLLNVTSVMHINAIPTYVERGSHLDRHSETLLSESKYPVEVYSNIMEIANSKEHDILCVLERRNWDLAHKDLQEIKAWKEKGREVYIE